MHIARHEVGPRYAQLVVHDGLAYIAGQVADTMDGDIRQQTAEVLAKIDALAAKAGVSKSHLLSVNVWIADFADYAAFNEVYAAWVDPADKPARATVRAELLDPRLKVEIMAVAAVPPSAGSSARQLADATAEVSGIDVADAMTRLGDDRLLFVDVRERHERAEGTIAGSAHAPRGYLEFLLDPASDFHSPELTAGRTLVMFCGSGARSTLAAQLAVRLGLEARYLRGGIRAWRDAGGRVEQVPTDGGA
jgi:enamine deaminase RidA (YjgF/YER057c/UK114 family)/rhodanese-related sulfurtransferase